MPAGTPDAIVNKASEDLRAILAQPELRKRLASFETYPRSMSAAEIAAFIRSEQTLWKPIVKQVMVATH